MSADIAEQPAGFARLLEDGDFHAATVPLCQARDLEPDNLTLPLGPPSGYVIRFTNGLVVYLTGDTAVHADMKTVVADFHKPNAMVLNLGLSAITMASGAYIANELIRPALYGAWLAGASLGAVELAHRRGHIARAVVEASALALRHVAEPMLAAGVTVDAMRVCGGPARSETSVSSRLATR